MEYVRIVAGGVLWFLPTAMGKWREFMCLYVCICILDLQAYFEFWFRDGRVSSYMV